VARGPLTSQTSAFWVIQAAWAFVRAAARAAANRLDAPMGAKGWIGFCALHERLCLWATTDFRRTRSRTSLGTRPSSAQVCWACVPHLICNSDGAAFGSHSLIQHTEDVGCCFQAGKWASL
jgi:hypothetical protein